MQSIEDHPLELDVAALRADTPGVANRVHLNNAGAGLMPEPVKQALIEHLELESAIGGYEAAELKHDEVARAYESVAALVGADARNIALTEHATASFAQALSSIPFAPGEAILTTKHDYVSNQIMYLSLRKRMGVKVLWVEDSPEGGADLQAFEAAIQLHTPRLVAVTHVPTNSGLVQDVAGIGSLCRRFDVLYLLDACQSVGQMPLDVKAIGCDFLSGTGRKFLRGPRASGFLYVSNRVLESELEPLLPDLRGARWIAPEVYRPAADATRFESWEFSYALVLGLGAASRYAMHVGLEATYHRAKLLATELRNQLSSLPNVAVLDQGRELCAIVTAHVENWDSAALVRALRDRGVNTWWLSRECAVFDLDAKGVEATLRISPHYYNTVEEIEACIAVIQDLTTS